MSKTVIFNLGGVCFCNGTQIAIGLIASKYKIKREMVENILNGDLGGKYRTGMITSEEFWNQGSQYLNIDRPPEELSTIWCRSYQPIDGTVRVIDRLKNAGHEIMYLSDNTKERVEYLNKKYCFLEKFDDGIFSHLVKRRKPDPIMYQLILGKASHSDGACIYIDDNPDFLRPAQDLGIEVIAFKNHSQLETELKDLSLLPNQF